MISRSEPWVPSAFFDGSGTPMDERRRIEEGLIAIIRALAGIVKLEERRGATNAEG
jgi:hypothetical protein